MEPEYVEFDSTRRARLVREGRGDDPHGLLGALGLNAGLRNPLLLVAGGADELQGPEMERARALICGAVSSAAGLPGVALLDGGTAAGVMLLTGAARAEDPEALPVLLGVAPAGKVSYPGAASGDGVPLDPNHTHFVLANSAEWGGETETMFAVAHALAGGAPAALVLAGGGTIAKAETVAAIDRGWPVFVLEGTGGTAEKLAADWRRYREPRPRPHARVLPPSLRYRRPPDVSSIGDADLRRIIHEGDIRCFGAADAADLARQITWELHDEPVLKDAWRTFATYDSLAAKARRSFERFQKSILGLGILATLLALLYNSIRTPTLHWLAVAAPIVVSSVIALTNRRAGGNHWVLLRAAAESVKTEIYRYRTRAGVYADARLPDGDRTARPRALAAQLDRLEDALMHTEASSTSLDPYEGPLPPHMDKAGREDDGLSLLDASGYLQTRVADQLNYFAARVSKLTRLREALQALAVLAGGSGAILAAAGVEVWIGLTTALSGAALSYLGYLQVDNTIVAYNQAASTLRRLQRHWEAMSRHDAAAFDALVTSSEAVLGTELGGWVQQMTQAVDRLQAQQTPAADRDQPTTSNTSQ